MGFVGYLALRIAFALAVVIVCVVAYWIWDERNGGGE